jgi:hypothetical protein
MLAVRYYRTLCQRALWDLSKASLNLKRTLWGDKPEGLLPENCPNFLAGQALKEGLRQKNPRKKLYFFRPLWGLSRPWTSPLRVLKEARPLRVFKEARPLRVFKEARPDFGPFVTECGSNLNYEKIKKL